MRQGAPLQPQRIGRRIKDVAADWKLPFHQLECGWRGCFAGAVVVSIRLETVVEKSVLVILGVALGEGANNSQTQQAQDPERGALGLRSLG